MDTNIPSGIDSDLETPTSPVDATAPANPVDEQADTVKYDSYKKLLSEKKKIQKELDKVLNESSKRQEEELASQSKFKELWEAKNSEAEELKAQLKSHEDRWNDAVKLDAFTKGLGDKRIPSKYVGFVDTSKILIDPDTGRVDALSVQQEVDRVSTEYPEIIRGFNTTQLPNATPSAASTLTREEWLKLPTKEMAARMKEVKD